MGCLNMLFKLGSRSVSMAQKIAGVSILLFIWAFWPLDDLDPYSPHLIFSCLVLGLLLLNAGLVMGWGNGLTLNRSELVLVFIMLVAVSVVCTLGLSSTLLPTITGFLYFATPSNRWLNLVQHLRRLARQGFGAEVRRRSGLPANPAVLFRSHHRTLPLYSGMDHHRFVHRTNGKHHPADVRAR